MLTLYYKPSCPYSARVIAEAEDLGLSFDLKNIAADEALRDELIAKGGKKQVPYLIDASRDEAMYDSGDIIEYLREHYGNGATNASGLRVYRSDASCDVCE